MKKYATTISDGTIAKCFIEARPQHNPSTHESLSCANKRTTTAASSSKKSLVPLYYMYEYHAAAALVIST